MEIHTVSLWRFWIIDWVAKDWRADVGHMDAELMRAAGARLKLDEAEAIIACDNLVLSNGFTAVFVSYESCRFLEIAG